MTPRAEQKTSLRQAQRDVTRTRIRKAARQLFAAAPFEVVSMEEIAREAQVGRTTIYLHYPTKNALLIELLQEDWERQAEFFERLGQSSPLDRPTLARWVNAYGASMRKARGLFRMYAFALMLDEEFGRLHYEHRERLIRVLGRGLPDLCTWKDATPDRRRAAAASHALMAHIEEYGTFVTRDVPSADADAATDVLVDALAAFLEEAPSN